MNQIERLRKVVCLIILFFVSNTGCKYDEGPIISFIIAERRVTGNYKLDRFYINDVDTSDFYNSLICNSGFSFNIKDDVGNITPYLPTYIYPCPFDFSAKWRLDDHSNLLSIGLVYNLPILGPWGQEWEFDWNIIKLTDDEMYIGGKSFSTTYRLEFKKI